MVQRPHTSVQTQGDLARLLLDFAHAPGRYAIRLGEPHALFRELRTVVRWAQGRIPDARVLGEDPPDERELVHAAVLFIQRACFDRESTHYQVMGLTPEMFTHERLRARYRVLIRLTHPDFGVGGLPANAASMVNRAYDVLSDNAARRRYDETLARDQRARHGPVDVEEDATGHRPTRVRGGDLIRGLGRAPSWRERWSTWLASHPRQIRLALVGAGACVVLGGAFAWLALDAMHGAASALVATGPAPAPAARPVRESLALRQAPQTEAGTRASAAAIAEPGAIRDVDARGARDYLDDVVAALQRVDDTQYLNDRLARMHVQGSLLAPVADLQRRAPRLAVERTGWTETRRPGALGLHSTLVLQTPAENAEVRVYRLAAEFRQTPQGAVLERLDLQRRD